MATYTGSGIAAKISSKSGSILTTTYYSDSSCTTKTTTSNATAAGGTPKTVGTYYVIAKSAGNATYSVASLACTKAVVINKANDNVMITLKNAEYTGSGIATTTKATSGSKVTITYYSDSKCATKTTTSNAIAAGGTPKSIGTYYAIAKSAGNTNYNAGTSKCTKAVVITKKSVQIKAASINMGGFKCGASSFVCFPTQNDFTNLFKNNGIDIVGVQEAEHSTNGANSMINAGKNAGLTYWYTKKPAQRDGTLSKYQLDSNTYKSLSPCGEARVVTKSVITINGVKISFYNTHLGLNKGGSDCNTLHYEDLANYVKNDSNPVIITGDFNSTVISKFNTYLKPLGAVIAAYDTSTNNMWKKKSYCDMVVVIPKNHITVVKGETVNTYKLYSDHNMVVATLSIK